eukprot:TRINITY_DN15534_c0_g1_i2.p1 TRINITY_DN15534_c0_g1~~TRINITY_DN15534_c0_g1_i2.p1  ORF type:complete len:505 (-),score=6.08 TRINITY_DN15534_c0_g1_i2:102-1616(-)
MVCEHNAKRVFAKFGIETKDRILFKHSYNNQKWRIRDCLVLRKLSRSWKFRFDSDLETLCPRIDLVEKPYDVKFMAYWFHNLKNLDIRNCGFQDNPHIITEIIITIPEFKLLKHLDFGKSLQDVFQWKALLHVEKSILNQLVQQRVILSGMIVDNKAGYMSVVKTVANLAAHGIHMSLDVHIYRGLSLIPLIQVCNQSNSVKLKLKLLVSSVQEDVQAWILRGKNIIQSFDTFQGSTFMTGYFLRQLLVDNDILQELRLRASYQSQNLTWGWSLDPLQQQEEMEAVLYGLRQLNILEWEITGSNNLDLLLQVPIATHLHLYDLDIVRRQQLSVISKVRIMSIRVKREEYDPITSGLLQEKLLQFVRLTSLNFSFCNVWNYINLGVLSNLSSLQINSTWETSEDIHVTELKFLQQLTNLTQLELQTRGLILLSNFNILLNQRKLRVLILSVLKSNSKEIDMSMLKRLKRLERITFWVQKQCVPQFLRQQDDLGKNICYTIKPSSL